MKKSRKKKIVNNKCNTIIKLDERFDSLSKKDKPR